jgi:hypothetical protein
MEVLCDHIDGTLTFIANFTLQALEFSIINDDLNSIGVTFPNLVIFKDSHFLAVVKQEIRVDTCLLVLSVLSYLITRRLDL